MKKFLMTLSLSLAFCSFVDSYGMNYNNTTYTEDQIVGMIAPEVGMDLLPVQERKIYVNNLLKDFVKQYVNPNIKIESSVSLFNIISADPRLYQLFLQTIEDESIAQGIDSIDKADREALEERKREEEAKTEKYLREENRRQLYTDLRHASGEELYIDGQEEEHILHEASDAEFQQICNNLADLQK